MHDSIQHYFALRLVWFLGLHLFCLLGTDRSPTLVRYTFYTAADTGLAAFWTTYRPDQTLESSPIKESHKTTERKEFFFIFLLWISVLLGTPSRQQARSEICHSKKRISKQFSLPPCNEVPTHYLHIYTWQWGREWNLHPQPLTSTHSRRFHSGRLGRISFRGERVSLWRGVIYRLPMLSRFHSTY